MASRYMKKYSETLVIREMQIFSTMRCGFIHISMVIIKKQKKTVEDMGK